ncbi:MAG: hypothetical protein MMC33_004637 [Icmadophila ericetorum]|nr:hypothetical protein [Icmadophila ericetorum]
MEKNTQVQQNQATPDIASLISQLKAVENNVPTNEAARKELLDAVRRVGFALEKEGDTIQRICYLPIQLTVARIANDLNLFDILVEANDNSLSVAELAGKTKTDPILLSTGQRLLRFLASNAIVKETGPDSFAASHITKTLAIPGVKGGINHNFDTMLPCYQALPEHLRSTSYRNPTDGANCAFQLGHHTDLPAFAWLPSHPSNLHNFMQWMTGHRIGYGSWLDVFPVEKELLRLGDGDDDTDPNLAVFVDVGGSIGHQCVALVEKYPQLKGRVVLQDRPEVVANAIPNEGVKAMAHDFMTEQPIKGAKAYYLRNILHDYPDAICLTILANLKSSLSPSSSVILIDEMILPNTGIHWHQAQLDIGMMAGLAAVERSESQWRELIARAGLKIRSIWKYTLDLEDSVLVLGL